MKYKKRDKKNWYKEIKKNLKIRSRISNVKDKFSDFLDLPPEVVSKITKITSIENTDILIEGYEKIIDYYDDYIKIRGNNMDILIDGRSLDIKEITDSELVIQGEVYSFNYKKTNKG